LFNIILCETIMRTCGGEVSASALQEGRIANAALRDEGSWLSRWETKAATGAFL